MINYLLGYEYYLKKCEQYGLEPLNYRSFISNLTDEQLIKFMENAITHLAWNLQLPKKTTSRIALKNAILNVTF